MGVNCEQGNRKRFPCSRLLKRSNRGPASSDQLDNKNDHRYHEEQMYQSSDGCAADAEAKAQRPKHDKNKNNGPKHMFFSFLI